MTQQHYLDYEGRLQRKPDITGRKITRFREVLFRHGLFVSALALACFGLPQSTSLLKWGLSRFMVHPAPYFVGAFCLLLFLMILSRVFHQGLNARQMVWIIYLLGISFAEEWVFRLALPGFVAGFTGIPRAVLLCNLAFAAMHYFTLRWKLRWCVGAFFGAMGLSRLMGHGDLLLVVGVHWLATFLNTPVAVGSGEKRNSLPPRPERAEEK
jgi:membrane protease YdiL (CAAX protease family)